LNVRFVFFFLTCPNEVVSPSPPCPVRLFLKGILLNLLDALHSSLPPLPSPSKLFFRELLSLSRPPLLHFAVYPLFPIWIRSSYFQPFSSLGFSSHSSVRLSPSIRNLYLCQSTCCLRNCPFSVVFTAYRARGNPFSTSSPLEGVVDWLHVAFFLFL